MNKYIGFDIDSKKIVACVVENGKKDIYQTLKSDIGSMRKFLEKQKSSGHRVELAFEISGQAGFIYDSLIDCVDEIWPAQQRREAGKDVMKLLSKISLILAVFGLALSCYGAANISGKAVYQSKNYAVETVLPVYLNENMATFVFQRNDANDVLYITMKFHEQNTGKVPTSQIRVKLAGKALRHEQQIDISSWPDGEYKVYITEKSEPGQYVVRGIFKQTLLEPQAPSRVVDMAGVKMFFVDDWYFEKTRGLKRQVVPAELVPIEPWKADMSLFRYRNGIDKYWFDVNGVLNVKVTGLNKPKDAPISYWAQSRDLENWTIVDKPVKQDPEFREVALGSKSVSFKSNNPNYRWYDAEKDGPVNLKEVQVVYTGLKKNTKWGQIEVPFRSRMAVWEKDDERLLLATVTSDKHKFGPEDIGTWKDSNDNFGAARLSPDGKKLLCYQSRLIPRHEPFRVHFDNIKCSRMMIIWSTEDGINWEPSFYDAPNYEDPRSIQHYGVNIWTEEKDRLELAYHKIYDVEYQKVYTELAYSRDGVLWKRFEDSKPFMDTGAPGDWNFGYSIITDKQYNRKRMEYKGHDYETMVGINVLHFMFLQANNNDRDKNTLSREYIASKFDDQRLLSDKGFQTSPIMEWYDGDIEVVLEELRKQTFTPALMKYRKDGWVAATTKQHRAVIETKRFNTSGGKVNINAQCKPQGFVMVEVLDDVGNDIEAYCGRNAAFFKGDDVQSSLKWSKGSVSKLPQIPFKLRVTIEESKLFTLEFCE